MEILRLDSGPEGLGSDEGSEVDLVRGRPNAGTELNHEVSGIGPKLILHQGNGLSGDATFTPLFPGMQNAERSVHGICQVNSATVCHIDSKNDSRNLSDESICFGSGENAEITHFIHDGDSDSMDLLSFLHVSIGEAQMSRVLAVP
jgi:hypothetical protein